MEKKYKLIKDKDLSQVRSLKALNDGNLAIGLSDFLAIYNMTTFKVNLKIKSSGHVSYIYQLKNNYIFFHSCFISANKLISINNLIELSNKTWKGSIQRTYIDKTEQLPNNSKYNILKENQKGILYGCLKQRIDVLKKKSK